MPGSVQYVGSLPGPGSYCCCNKLPVLKQNPNLLSDSYRAQKSKSRLGELKPKRPQGFAHFRGSREESATLPFSEGCLRALALAPASIQKSNSIASSDRSGRETLLPPSYKFPCDGKEPSQIIQNSLSISRDSFNHICKVPFAI